MEISSNVAKGLWQVSSNGEWIDPNDYPYLIEWVNTAMLWVKKYRIREYIPAVDGFDPSGRVMEEDWSDTDESSEMRISPSRIWSSIGLDDYLIIAELSFGSRGSHMVFGWYVGELDHNQDREYIPSMMHVCRICRGSRYVFIPSDFSMEDIHSSSMFEIREDEDGIHLRPLQAPETSGSEEEEEEVECTICEHSWICLEDTSFKLASENHS